MCTGPNAMGRFPVLFMRYHEFPIRNMTLRMTERDLHTGLGRYIAQDWNPRSAFSWDRYVSTEAVASQPNLTCDTASLGSAPIQGCLHVFDKSTIYATR